MIAFVLLYFNRLINSGVSRIGEGKDDVILLNHSKVAMVSFTWVNKKEATPVLEYVAASFRAIIPLLPMPVKTNLPEQDMISFTAAS